jgi:hypothetical protein
VTDYTKTHGRCHRCNVIYAWPSGKGKRLKDNPACPKCGFALVRTCAGLSYLGRSIDNTEPEWNPARQKELQLQHLIAKERNGHAR